MRVAILQGAFLPVPPKLGGAVEKMWFLLGQKFYERGHIVTHISRQWENLPEKELIHGVKHIRVAGFVIPKNILLLKILDAVYTFRAIKAIPKDAEIIVTNTFFAPIFVPMFRSGKIYVDVARMPKGQMRFYNRASILRANSTPVADAIISELDPSRPSQVSMIPNPLPFEETALEVIKLNDLSTKSGSILYCGRIHPEKGLELLVKAINALPNGWVFTIVGPWKTSQGGGGKEYLRTLKALFDVSKVKILEPIFDINKLNELYKESAIFVYPSVAEKGETFGLAPLEAMAWGAVPIVSELACFKDFIKHNENGLIFNHRGYDAIDQLMQCIHSLIENPAKRCQLANEGLKVRVSHSPDRIADLFLADFEKILS